MVTHAHCRFGSERAIERKEAAPFAGCVLMQRSKVAVVGEIQNANRMMNLACLEHCMHGKWSLQWRLFIICSKSNLLRHIFFILLKNNILLDLTEEL